MNLKPSDYQDEINRLRAAAKGPHYAFVQFLVAICGGMLGLSAPGQSERVHLYHVADLFSVAAMSCLALSVIFGVIALYGDKNAPDCRWKLMERLRKKFQGDEIRCKLELEKQAGVMRPPAIHRWSFHIQWTLGLAAIILLVCYKAAPIFSNVLRSATHQEKLMKPANSKSHYWSVDVMLEGQTRWRIFCECEQGDVPEIADFAEVADAVQKDLAEVGGFATIGNFAMTLNWIPPTVEAMSERDGRRYWLEDCRMQK